MRRYVAAAAVVPMVATAIGWGQVAAQEGTPEESVEVCAAARRSLDGRVEIALQRLVANDGCGERLLPQRRFLPASGGSGQWLVTSPLEVEGHEILVTARRLSDGRVEFAVRRRLPEDGSWSGRLLPQSRFLPATSAAGRWFSSSAVDALVAPQSSVLEEAQVVSFYGHPGAPVMGVLGRGSPAAVAEEIAAWAASYDRLNGSREVIAAFHLITGVAQAHATPDGTWLYRLSARRIAEYVEVARERGMLVFLDVQIGWSDPLAEVRLLEPFLRERFVHVALDPEFATRRQGVRPGLAIGSVTAEQVNEVQRYLAALVSEEGLPPKILMVHQFTPGMLRDRGAVEDVEGVDLSIDMDGFGGIAIKLAGYDSYSLREPSEWPALKLFFEYDTPVMTPDQVQGLDRAPDLIIYQ